MYDICKGKTISNNTKVWDFFIFFFFTLLEQSELDFTEMRIIPLKSLKLSGAGAQIYYMELKRTELRQLGCYLKLC